MKTLLLFGFLMLAGAVFISATKKNYHREPGSDKMFANSIQSVVSLAQYAQLENELGFNREFSKLNSSLTLLIERYPDLTHPASSAKVLNMAMDSFHGDSCLRILVHDVFACFRTCSSHRETKACLATACANYQVCKEGGPRR